MKYTLTIEGDNIEEMLRGLVHMWSSQTSLSAVVSDPQPAPERPLSTSDLKMHQAPRRYPGDVAPGYLPAAASGSPPAKPPAEPQPQPEPAPGPEPEPLPPAAKGNGHSEAAPKQKRGRGRPVGSYKGDDGKMVIPEAPAAKPEIDPEHSDAAMLDKVRLFIMAHKHLNPSIDALVKTYGVDRVSRLPQDVRGTFLVQMEALLAHQANPEVPQDREWT